MILIFKNKIFLFCFVFAIFKFNRVWKIILLFQLNIIFCCFFYLLFTKMYFTFLYLNRLYYTRKTTDLSINNFLTFPLKTIILFTKAFYFLFITNTIFWHILWPTKFLFFTLIFIILWFLRCLFFIIFFFILFL